MGRAAAHGLSKVPRFSDPTAFALIPPEMRAGIEAFRAGEVPKKLRGRFRYGYFQSMARYMAVRTVVIDDAIRAAPTPQLVILGAGLDGRAWRMPELHDTIVFEVDHPDSQKVKRGRVEALTQAAREVRFVPVDLTHDSLEKALAGAGHDPAQPTTWVWEGVIMYLTPAQVDATLTSIAARSAKGSRLIALYNAPSGWVFLFGWLFRRMGEPLRSKFRAPQMRALLTKHGFDVAQDGDLITLARALSPETAREMRHVRHARIVIADAS